MHIGKGSDFSGRLTFTPSSDDFEFDTNKVLPIKNISFIKPSGGFWLSVDGMWEKWCDSWMPEWIGNKSFDVELQDDANILVIDSAKDVADLPRIKDTSDFLAPFVENLDIDFEALSGDYDGMCVLVNHPVDRTALHRALYGWDCDSILVFNAEAIKSFKIRENSGKNIEPIPIDTGSNEYIAEDSFLYN